MFFGPFDNEEEPWYIRMMRGIVGNFPVKPTQNDQYAG
jgi:hypothetical protein